MLAKYQSGLVIANCSGCDDNNVSNFETKSLYHKVGVHSFKNSSYDTTSYLLMRCMGCSAGGMATIHCHNQDHLQGRMESFIPLTTKNTKLPSKVPEDILKEYREAEKSEATGAYRGAASLIRSTLEKTLKKHGYTDDTEWGLKKKIELAHNEGIITAQLKQKATSIKVLGDNILHDEWREVTPTEIDEALIYAHRILENFYDDPDLVKNILIEKGRLKEEPKSE